MFSTTPTLCAACGRAQVLLPGAWCADCASFAGALPAPVPAPAAPSPELEATWAAELEAAQLPLGPNSAAGPGDDDLDIPY